MHSRRIHKAALALLLVLGLVPSVASAQEGSGLPLPRFVSLRAPEANMRTGPGEQYPIKWTYRRPGLPLEVVKEYHHWRRVRDWQGAEGWMHSSMLTGKRSIIVTGEVRTLRAKPDGSSAAIARIEGKVVGRLLRCPKTGAWCRIEIEKVQGWLKRGEIWGVYEEEEVD
jgi:SH3-like domain-containing protein